MCALKTNNDGRIYYGTHKGLARGDVRKFNDQHVMVIYFSRFMAAFHYVFLRCDNRNKKASDIRNILLK